MVPAGMKTPELSVIVPLYQEFRWLDKAIQSLQENRFSDWEAVLINDGSTVDPRPLLEPFLKDSRLRYVEKVHEGSAAARNFGLRLARGPWVAFLDQDDRVLPDRFSAQWALGSGSGPDVAGVYSDYERIDEEGKVLDHYASRATGPGRFVQEALGERGLVAVGAALIRKNWIDQVGGFDPELSGYEESDLVVRIALNGGTFSYLPGAVYQWRNHARNTMKSPEFQEERRLRFVAKLEKLARDHPSLQEILPEFRARTWYKIGLFHAESGAWRTAREWCWKAWKQDPRLWPALYLIVKACFK